MQLCSFSMCAYRKELNKREQHRYELCESTELSEKADNHILIVSNSTIITTCLFRDLRCQSNIQQIGEDRSY